MNVTYPTTAPVEWISVQDLHEEKTDVVKNNCLNCVYYIPGNYGKPECRNNTVRGYLDFGGSKFCPSPTFGCNAFLKKWGVSVKNNNHNL